MKKSLLSLAIMVLLSACQDDAPTEQSASAPTTNINPNRIVVGTNIKYYPYNFLDEKHQAQGLEIDILRAIGKQQNIEFHFETMPWELLVKERAARGIDVVADGIAAEDVASTFTGMLMSQSYANSADCVLVKKQTPLSNWNKGKIALVPDDLLDTELTEKQLIKDAEKQIVHTRTLFQSVSMVANDEVDAAVSDCIAVKYNAKNELFKDTAFSIETIAGTNAPETADLLFAINPDKPELRDKINAGLAAIKQNGELDAILKKWTE